ncbi:methyltransferase, FxLD system [Streptosporangium sp. NBC_01495]|uniref:methyltransferase, FxLD system n=1 Tax=Streptosporangium sp. NBC_01495 TaxID=2903899 RepID=UPI002E37B07F|nr:methyltransferase, FxLD system [Streptosporangium sp. NBC_01495]
MPTTWHQYNVEFPDRSTAVTIAAQELRPMLNMAQDAGLLHGWWFVRKQPWRLRVVVDDPTYTIIGDLLDTLTDDGRITGWAPGIYEPETTAFGGLAAMDIAHTLFHHDSDHLLARAAKQDVSPLGQREITPLLCSVLLRGAGLDWYEQGDVWKKVAELRPAQPDAIAPDKVVRLTAAMRRLMTVDTRALCEPTRDGPLTGYDRWVTAFEDAGQALADLSRHGRLRRGLRAVTAHHIIFHANRAGLSIADQSVLAALALNTVFMAEGNSVFPSAVHPTTTKVSQMTTLSDSPASSMPSADQLRADMSDQLSSRKVIRTPAVEEAFRRTPRHLFIPDVPLDQAYDNKPVYTKTAEGGVCISAASQPGMVAVMLEQLEAQPGEQILEIGAGTGYNAALMAAIVGETGRIVSIDVDSDLVDGAREHLAAVGVKNVEVILGDGVLGHPESAPYDRVIATVGAFETPTAWLEQLAPSGRLVVPLRLRGTASRSIVFERGQGGWRSVHSTLAVFMPLRGIGDDARRIVVLTPEGDVTLQVHKDQAVDGHALAGALDTERHERWTGVIFPPEVPYEWMELWLCLHLANPLMRMNVEPTATEHGQVTPMFPWGSMATTRDADLAYLTTRPAPPAEDGGKLYEVGVIGHGPSGHDLAELVAQQVQTWDADCRSRSVRFEIPDSPVTADPAAGRFVLERPHHPITVIWE